MGHIPVGYLRPDQLGQANGVTEDDVERKLDYILCDVPITHGRLQWNCQNWVVAGLQALADAGFDIKTYSQQEMLQLFLEMEE